MNTTIRDERIERLLIWLMLCYRHGDWEQFDRASEMLEREQSKINNRHLEQ